MHHLLATEVLIMLLDNPYRDYTAASNKLPSFINDFMTDFEIKTNKISSEKMSVYFYNVDLCLRS